MRYILVIGDGMADDPTPVLGGKTPLESVETPVMDRLSAGGILGSVWNCPQEFPAGSDTAILSIFGCDPRVCYTGRAPLEAAAQGVRLQPGDLAFRCNMASLEEGDMPFDRRRIISHSSGGIDGETSKALVEALFAHPDFRSLAEAAGLQVHPTLTYRHICVQAQGDPKGLVLSPPHDHLNEVCGPYLPHGSANGDILRGLMEKSFEILRKLPANLQRQAEGKLPANCIWFWAEGTAVELPSFPARYGKRGAVISAVPLCHGIAALTGLDRIQVPGATGEKDTNYRGKADYAVRALLEQGYDFVGIHVEAPDECTHNGDTPGKLESIAAIDREVLGTLTEKLAGEDYRILVLSDHKTLTDTRGHAYGYVPFLLYDSRGGEASGLTYTEANGLLGPRVEDGTALMDLLFQTGAKA